MFIGSKAKEEYGAEKYKKGVTIWQGNDEDLKRLLPIAGNNLMQN